MVSSHLYHHLNLIGKKNLIDFRIISIAAKAGL